MPSADRACLAPDTFTNQAPPPWARWISATGATEFCYHHSRKQSPRPRLHGRLARNQNIQQRMTFRSERRNAGLRANHAERIASSNTIQMLMNRICWLAGFTEANIRVELQNLELSSHVSSQGAQYIELKCFQ